MTWDEFFQNFNILDPDTQRKLQDLFPTPADINQQYRDSLGVGGAPGQDPAPKGGGQNIAAGGSSGTIGGGTQWPGTPDVLPEDRQSYLDMMSPAGQTLDQFLRGINTPAEDAITSGAQSMTNRLMEGLAAKGTTGGGMETALKSQIERGAIGETAKSRLATMMAGLQGKMHIGDTYAGLLHQQRPVPQYQGLWKAGVGSGAPGAPSGSTEGDHPQWDPYEDEEYS